MKNICQINLMINYSNIQNYFSVKLWVPLCAALLLSLELLKHRLSSRKIIFLLVLLWPNLAMAEEQIWLKDFDVALKKAQAEKKPILVFVTAKWCSFCTMMHNSTLTNPKVITILNKFIRVEIDYDQNPEFCARWDAEKLPTTLLFNQYGEAVSKLNGFKEPEEFMVWLSQNDKVAQSNISIKETSRQGIQKIFDSFKTADQAGQNTIFVNILDAYYQQKDKEMKDFIILKIIDIIQINPQYFESLISHSRLEARILATLILEKLKSDLIYDPWETTQTRQEQIKIILPQLDTLKARKVTK